MNPCTSPENYTATEGQRLFEVRAIDAVGNVDPTPASYTWVVDLTPPVVTITTPANKQHVTLHGPLTPVFNYTDPLAGARRTASGVATCTQRDRRRDARPASVHGQLDRQRRQSVVADTRFT